MARFGTFVTTPSITEANASVSIKTTLKNEYKTEKNIKLVSKIVDKNGNVLDVQTSAQSVAAFEQVEIVQLGSINKPSLWSPESPYLYKVLTEVSENGNVVDNYETTFGVRTFEVNKNGVFLNGKLCPIKGTCNHQDFAGIGVALPDKINWYKLKILKDLGSNAYRTTHHPPTPELLDMCDSMDSERGVYVLSIVDSYNNLKDILRVNDAIIKFDGKIINNLGDLQNAFKQADLSKPIEMVVFRNQKETLVVIPKNTFSNR